MNQEFGNLSKQELIALLEAQSPLLDTLSEKEEKLAQSTQQIANLKLEVQYYKGLFYGQKRERFEGNKDQLALPFEQNEQQKQQQEEETVEKIEYQRKKRPNHKGRLPLPDHLEVEEIHLHPEVDLEDMVCIGKEVTEELECIPAKFYIKRYIRYKYAPKDKSSVSIAQLPERVIEKGIPGAGLLAMILVDKYFDHLPLYRQLQRFQRAGITIASSTLEGWVRQSLAKLEILYEHLQADTLSKGYLQIDETPIKVLDAGKKNKIHRGYYWVAYCPLDKTVLFSYQPSRSGKAADHLLADFKGYLQTDAYAVYHSYGQSKDVAHLICWAHARREFVKAVANDKQRAETALTYIQKIYAVEAKARKEDYSPQQRKELRLTEALPSINELGKWLVEQAAQVLPKSQIGKAIAYATQRWKQLSAYLYDGSLEIDNNLVENSIRPIAIGRKNYLFAGSHDAAQRAAMIYSFFAICKTYKVNPYEWLKYTLENIMTISIKDIKQLYPQNFKKMLQNQN